MSVLGIGSSMGGYSIGQMMSNMQTRGPSASEEAKEKPDFTELVTALDADQSGSLDTEAEIQSLAEAVGYDTGVSGALSKFLTTYDTDESGTISEDEAVTALEANGPQGPPPPPPGGMQPPDESDMVSEADTNEDGVISEEEAASLVDIINNATGSELEAEDLISEYDSDGDGAFTTDEAIAAMEANRPEPPSASGTDGGSSFEEEFIGQYVSSEDEVLTTDQVDEIVSFINGATGSELTTDQLISDYGGSSDEGLTGAEAIAAMEAYRPEGDPAPTEVAQVNTVAVEAYMSMMSMSSLGSGNTGSMMDMMMGNRPGPFSGMA